MYQKKLSNDKSVFIHYANFLMEKKKQNFIMIKKIINTIFHELDQSIKQLTPDND